MRLAVRIISILLCLLTGTILYIFLNPNVIFLEPVCEQLPARVQVDDNICLILMRNYMADMLWYCALILTIDAIPRPDMPSKVVYFLTLMLPFVIECLQGVHLLHGIFDWWDIFAYVIVLIIYLIWKK